MNIAEVENVIISSLQTAFPDFECCSFPTKFEEYTFTSPVGCLLVKYDYTQFTTQETVWTVQQSGNLKFSIIAGYRGLQNYKEIHPYQAKIRTALRGLELYGRKFTIGKEEFLSEINGDLYVGLDLGIKITEEDEYEI